MPCAIWALAKCGYGIMRRGRWQTKRTRNLPYIGLGELRLAQGRPHFKFTGRLRAWPPIARVTQILAIRQHAKVPLSCNQSHVREKLMFTEVTAVDRIVVVVGILKFSRAHDLQRKTQTPRPALWLRSIPPRQARRICNHRQHAVAQFLVRHVREQHRIHPTRIRDEARFVLAQHGPQCVKFEQSK